jgi:NAD+ synthase (glutamine-hydrolysing)
VVRFINREREIIPASIIERPPTAELREDQKDEDSLPPYHKLDPVLKLLVEDHLSKKEIVDRGYEKALVDKVYDLYKKAEFKRFQLPPGIKITKKAYGVGRRIPITNHWHGG